MTLLILLLALLGIAVDAQSAQVEYQHNWLRTPRPFGLNVRVLPNKEMISKYYVEEEEEVEDNE